jgi:hypothetical protein
MAGTGQSQLAVLRFYFTIEGDTYMVSDIIPHPK